MYILSQDFFFYFIFVQLTLLRYVPFCLRVEVDDHENEASELKQSALNESDHRCVRIPQAWNYSKSHLSFVQSRYCSDPHMDTKRFPVLFN